MTKPIVETSPDSYIKIIKTCRKIGEMDIALLVCDKGIQKFSKDINLYNAKGEIHLLQFNLTKKMEDLKPALTCFEKVLLINPHNYLAKIYCGKIYLRMGLLDKAKAKFQSILQTAPDDTSALKYFKEAKKREEQKQKTDKEKAEESPKGPDPLKVSVEEEAVINFKALTENFSILKSIKGLKALLLIDQFGTIIRSYNRSDLDENLLSSVSANIFRSSKAGLTKIGLGSFKNGMLMTPLGNFYFTDTAGAILLVLTSLETNQRDVEDTIQKFLTQVNE